MTRSKRRKARLSKEAAELAKRERCEQKISYRRAIALARDAGEIPSDLSSVTSTQDNVVNNEALFAEDGSEDREIREVGSKDKPMNSFSKSGASDHEHLMIVNSDDNDNNRIRDDPAAAQRAQAGHQSFVSSPNWLDFPTGTIPWQGKFPYMASVQGKCRAESHAQLAADAAEAAGLSAEAAKTAVLAECKAQCDLKRRLQEARVQTRGRTGSARCDAERLVDKLGSELRVKRKALDQFRRDARLAKQAVRAAEPEPATLLNRPGPTVLPNKPEPAALLPISSDKAQTRVRRFKEVQVQSPGLYWHDFGGPDEIPEFNIFTVVEITSKLESLLENCAFSFTVKHDPTQATYLVSAHALELHTWLRKLRYKNGDPRLKAGLCRNSKRLFHGVENAVLLPGKWEKILNCVTEIRHTATHRKKTNTETLLECVGAAGHLLDAMDDKTGFAVVNKLHLLVHATQEKLEEEVATLRKQGDRMFHDFDESSRPAEINMTILDARETICDRLVKQVIHLFAHPKHFQLEGVIC